MQQIDIYRGSQQVYPIQTYNRGGESDPAYAPTDTFSCSIYGGADESPLFSPAVAWWTNGGTQTGYDQGQVQVTITAAQSGTLEAAATYYGQVWWMQQTAPVAVFLLNVKPSPGMAVQDIATYCSYQDMLLISDDIRLLQRKDIDRTSFYAQRLQVRQWFDDLILNAYTGAGVVPFGDPGYPVNTWSGGWGLGGQIGTSKYMRDLLAQDRLIIHPNVINVCAAKAVGMVLLTSLGGAQFLVRGSYFDRQADTDVLNVVAEIDTATPMNGLAGISVPLGTARVVRV